MSHNPSKKVRHYSSEFLKYGFIQAPNDNKILFCLICRQCLTNESMKLGRLKAHLKAKHNELVNANLSYFVTLRDNFKNRTTITSIFKSKISTNCCIQEASYLISLLIAKNGKDHTAGEKIIKPALLIYLKTVLEKGYED